MNVSLTPELERLVNEKVESGLSQTASEIVREALRLLKERDHARNSFALTVIYYRHDEDVLIARVLHAVAIMPPRGLSDDDCGDRR